MDEDDDGHTHTALREAEEEVGLQPDNVTVWGKMPQVPGKVGNVYICQYSS